MKAARAGRDSMILAVQGFCWSKDREEFLPGRAGGSWTGIPGEPEPPGEVVPGGVFLGGFSHFSICASASVQNCRETLGQKGLGLSEGKWILLFQSSFSTQKEKKKTFGTVKEKFFGLFGVCFFQD